MNRIVIYTRAYNAEKTLRRAADSVLGQTYTNFTYYLLDNGSTDSTWDIIREYAAKEPRITPLRNEKNGVGHWAFEKEFINNREFSDNDYWCLLDADDALKPDFFRELLAFAEKYSLDMAACGSESINNATQNKTGSRVLPEDLIVADDGFSKHFPLYHVYMRAQWAKLIKFSLLREAAIWSGVALGSSYGADTAYTLQLLLKAARVGIIGRCLHEYYTYTGENISLRFDSTRKDSNRLLYDYTIKFLTEKTGRVSPRNDEFLLAAYMNDLSETLSVLLNADLPETEKIDALRDMFLCDHARKLATRRRFGARFNAAEDWASQRRQLFETAASWLLSREEIADGQLEGCCELGEFLCAAYENADGWIFFKRLLARFLVEQGRVDEAGQKLEELAGLLPDDDEIKAMIGDTGATSPR